MLQLNCLQQYSYKLKPSSLKTNSLTFLRLWARFKPYIYRTSSILL